MSDSNIGARKRNENIRNNVWILNGIILLFHINLGRFVEAMFTSPCFFPSHLTWWLLFNRTGTLNSSLVNSKASMPTESLYRDLFFELASVWQKDRHFSTIAGSIFLSDKGHITKVNVRNQHSDYKSWSKSTALLPVQRVNCNLVWVKNILISFEFL